MNRQLQESDFVCVSFLFILQELNVRQLTLSTDKDKYGIRLRAEPDHMVLGKRLKGAFKAVTASIKELTSEQLEAFQKTGIGVCAAVWMCVGEKIKSVSLLHKNHIQGAEERFSSVYAHWKLNVCTCFHLNLYVFSANGISELFVCI